MCHPLFTNFILVNPLMLMNEQRLWNVLVTMMVIICTVKIWYRLCFNDTSMIGFIVDGSNKGEVMVLQSR